MNIIDITSEELKKHQEFKKKVNSTPLDQIRLDGNFVNLELVANWRFTGLNNLDLFVNIEDITEDKELFTTTFMERIQVQEERDINDIPRGPRTTEEKGELKEKFKDLLRSTGA